MQLKRLAILFVHCTLFITSANAQTEITVFDEKTGQNEEIDLPEGMMPAELDSLLREWNTKNFIAIDETCQSTGTNPVYDKEEYIRRLSRLPNVIDMPYNEVVRKFIDQYADRLRRSVSIMLGASNFYFPLFEEALETYQMPLELRYLPVIESALNPGATSRVGAAGLWQFMLVTGRQYGLEVTSLIDERRDPVKSSYAAARYLKDLHDIFGDWTLAIAAYNCGPGNVSKAIKRAGGTGDYWSIYPYLPRETRGYVPAFIAANYAMTYYCEHNICPMTTRLPAQTDTVVVNKNVHLEQIAGVVGTDIDMLRSLNPEYRRDVVPGQTKPSAIRMPLADAGKFIDLEDSVYNYRTTEFLTKRAVVDVADDLPTYSRRGRAYYGRKSGRYSRRSARNSRRASARSGRGSRGGGSSITIRRGQTLSDIAKRNGTTVQKLRKLNGLKGNNIVAGKKLRVK